MASSKALTEAKITLHIHVC